MRLLSMNKKNVGKILHRNTQNNGGKYKNIVCALLQFSKLITVIFDCWPLLTAAMREILQAFEKPENKARIQEIEQEAGSDLVKLLQDRLPFAVEIQQEVIKSHGFSDDGDQGNWLFIDNINSLTSFSDHPLSRENKEQ